MSSLGSTRAEPYSRTKTAVALAGARVVAAGGLLLAMAVLSRVLDKAEYGLFRQAWTAFLVLAPLLSLGLNQSLLFFVPKTEGLERSRLIWRTFGVLLGSGFIAGAAIVLGRFDIAEVLKEPNAVGVVGSLGLFLAFAVPFQVFDGLLVPQGRVRWAALFGVANRMVVLLGCAVPILLGGVSLEHGLLSMAVLQMVLTGGLIVVASHSADIGSRIRFQRVVGLWEQIRFAIPIAAANVFGVLLLQADKVVVAMYVTAGEFASYANGSMENPLIPIASYSAMLAVSSDLVRFRDEKNVTAIVDLWGRAIRKVAMVGLPMSAFMFVFAEDVVSVLFSAQYADSASVFRVNLLGTPARIVAANMLFLALGRNGMLFVVQTGAALLTLFISRVVVSSMGGIGVMLGSVLVFSLMVLVQYCIAARDLSVDVARLLPWRPILAVAGLSVASSFGVWCCVNFMGLSGLSALLVGGSLFVPLEVYLLILFRLLKPSEWRLPSSLAVCLGVPRERL